MNSLNEHDDDWAESNSTEHGWPQGYDRIPDEDWLRRPVDESAMRYDKHGANAFRRNWDPTVAQVLTVLDESKVLLDYSCGTGLFAESLLQHVTHPARIINVDVSPKYLRLVADKFRHDDRVSLRLQKRVDTEGQFQCVDEVVGDVFLNRGIDILTSTNAVHLYPNIADTFQSWHRVLRRDGLALVSTGDMSNPKRPGSDWRLHDTVAAVSEFAREVVRTEARFEKYRHIIDDTAVMSAYEEMRRRVYPPIKPIDLYLDALSEAGLKPLHHFEGWIDISTAELTDALLPYHDVILGWIGGSQHVEGKLPSQGALRDRFFLIKYCVDKFYAAQHNFRCPWTYITCRKTKT